MEGIIIFFIGCPRNTWQAALYSAMDEDMQIQGELYHGNHFHYDCLIVENFSNKTCFYHEIFFFLLTIIPWNDKVKGLNYHESCICVWQASDKWDKLINIFRKYAAKIFPSKNNWLCTLNMQEYTINSSDGDCAIGMIKYE